MTELREQLPNKCVHAHCLDASALLRVHGSGWASCLRTKPGRRGQAPTLSIPQWEIAGPRIYLVILLTGLGLRCNEAPALKREDVCLNAAMPKVTIAGHTPGSRKSPGDVYVRKHHLMMTRAYLSSGITTSRT